MAGAQRAIKMGCEGGVLCLSEKKCMNGGESCGSNVGGACVWRQKISFFYGGLLPRQLPQELVLI